MNLITINKDKCKQCGICAAECPAKIIVLKDEKAYPAPVRRAIEYCIKCGHCIAVCPQSALSYKDTNPEECVTIQKDAQLSLEQVELLFKARRSIRVYQEKPVKRETLQKLIETARYAPTAKNLQHVDWIVIHDKNEVNRLGGQVIDYMKHMLQKSPEIARLSNFDLLTDDWERGVDRIFRGAPHVILTHAPAQQPYAAENCVGALTYLELAAYAMGLGSCWAGYFTTAAGLYEPIKKYLALPDGHRCFGAVMIGYPKYRYHRVPPRNNPKIDWR